MKIIYSISIAFSLVLILNGCNNSIDDDVEDMVFAPPVVTTLPVDSILEVSAITGGDINISGAGKITQKGVCWDVSPNPTITTNRSTDGTGAGRYVSRIQGLKSKTKYYVRAYAINNIGVGYGNEIIFTTKAIRGCTDPLSDNPNPVANEDDGSCTFQKRFIGEYKGAFSCLGLFSNIFTTADISVTERPNKDEVNIRILSNVGPFNVKGKITTRDTVEIDETIQNLSFRAGDIIAGGGDVTLKSDVRLKSKLYISPDNKKLTGILSVAITTKEQVVINNFPIPAGFTLQDDCDLTVNKL